VTTTVAHDAVFLHVCIYASYSYKHRYKYYNQMVFTCQYSDTILDCLDGQV